MTTSSTADSTVKLRSIYVSSPVDDDAEAAQPSKSPTGDDWGWLDKSAQNGEGGAPQSKLDNNINNNEEDDVKEDDETENLYESEPEPTTLPESTHTLFFTAPVLSLPFGFATAIVGISITCLLLALVNNLQENSSPGNWLGIPANVSE